MKMALAAQALDAENAQKRKLQGGSQDMTKYFQTTLGAQANGDYLPWKKTHFKEQAKITTNVRIIAINSLKYGPGFQNAISKIRDNNSLDKRASLPEGPNNTMMNVTMAHEDFLMRDPSTLHLIGNTVI